jgi:hypothetical protein
VASEKGENQNNAPEINTEPKKRSSKLNLIAVVVIAIIIVSVLSYLFLRDGQIEQDWFFQGAYANYEGSTSFLFISLNFSMRLEIVDFNSTHVETLSDIKLQAGSLGTLFSEQATQWVPAENLGTVAWDEMEGYVSGGEYEDHVYIEGLGTRLCKIYEFVQIDAEASNMNITVYVDPEIAWPLKLTFGITLEEDQNIIFDINLKDTNIPELM